MPPKKSSNKQAARAQSIPRQPRDQEVDAVLRRVDVEGSDEASMDDDPADGASADEEVDERADEDDEESTEPDVAARVAVKRKKAPQSQPLPPPMPQRVARDGEEDDLPDEVLEFVRAIDAYKRTKRRQFPSWSEVLDVLKQLGYVRRSG